MIHFVLVIIHTVFLLSSDVTTCIRCMAYTKHTSLHRFRPQPSLIAYRTGHRHERNRYTGRTVPSLSLSLPRNNISDHEKRILQQLIEPFDRWRYLQKLLDEDINDASDILFVLRTFVLQHLQHQQRQQYQDASSILPSETSLQSLSLRTTSIENTEATDSDATTLIATTSTKTDGIAAVSSTATPTVDDDDNDIKAKRRQIMEFIINDVSSDTIHNLIDPSSNTRTTEHDLLFLELMEQLLPQLDEDEDASKGLWDTIIELHGRESVKINERKVPQDIGWKTRCLIARLLIFYDFLTDGLNATHYDIATK